MVVQRWYAFSATSLLVALLGAVVVLQVVGVSHVLAATWFGRQSPNAAGSQARVGLLVVDEHHRRGFDLAVFNSASTAPKRGEVPSDQPQADPSFGVDPYADPRCQFGRVTLIAASEDATQSFATFVPRQGKPTLRREGDRFAGHTIAAISWDRVWLESERERCQIPIGDPAPPGTRPSRPNPAKSNKAPVRLPPQLAGKIERIDEGHFAMDRRSFEQLQQNPRKALDHARLYPIRHDGAVVGMRVAKIRPGSLLHLLGLRNGDQLVSVNGLDVTDANAMMRAYGRLLKAERFSFSLLRKGRPLSVELDIR